ncbi:MAG: MerR family transcriptional regulator [Myxococcota bacterium]
MNWQTGGEELLGIADVQTATGLSARTLRYYEELDLLPGVRRRAGGRRVYDADQVERVRFIQRLKKLGLSLAEIKELNAVYAIAGSTGDMLARLDQVLARHADQVAQRIDELCSLRDDIDRYRERIGRRIDAQAQEGS